MSMASIQIAKCLCFQKFRYKDEDRPGKKYREKDFITLQLNNLKDSVVRVTILCIDAENHELIHPNGLIGVDCVDGVYDKHYAVTKPSYEIVVPYIRIERMKIKRREYKNIPHTLRKRASFLQSPYRERFLSQCSNMETSHFYDTNKVCLGVIVTVENDHENLNGRLHAVSHVIRNASEKTKLGIIKLSKYYVPALTGADIDIFTTEESPSIEPGSYFVYVTCDSEIHGIHWKSDKYSPTEAELLYKRVISYKVPRFELKPDLTFSITATLHIKCPDSNQHCTVEFHYVPQKDTQNDETMCVDSQSISQDQSTTTCVTEFKSGQNDACSQENPTCNLYQVPQTKEMFCMMNMEPSRSNISSSGNIVATNVNGKRVLFCSTDGTVFQQMNASSEEPLLSQTGKSDEQGMFPCSPISGHIETQYSTTSHGNFLISPIFMSSSTFTQEATVADNKPFGYTRYILDPTDIMNKSQAGSDHSVFIAGDAIELGSQDAIDNSTLSSGPSIDSQYNSVPVSSPLPLFRNIHVQRKTNSNTTPWQVKESDDPAYYYCRDVFKQFKNC